METIYQNLQDFFKKVLDDLNCENTTKSYIISIFVKYKTSQFDFTNDSLTLLYAKAKEKQDFYTFQNIGDWIFFINSFNPGFLNSASSEYYHTLGRASYHSCFKLLKKEWKLFEELSDNFIYLEKETRKKIERIKLIF